MIVSVSISLTRALPLALSIGYIVVIKRTLYTETPSL